MNNSWLITLAIVGATTSFAVHAFSADKSESVFIDEGDGDFDTMPVTSKQASKAAVPSQDATTQAERPVKAAKKTRGEKIAEVLKEAPSAKPGPAPVVPPAPAPETKEEQLAVRSEAPAAAPAPAQEAPAPVAKREAKPKSKKVTQAPAKAPVKARVPASSKKGAGVYVTTKEACPMTREPASESPRMITVKPSKKIWVEKVEGGKWYRAYNKAGEPGYIDGDCVSVQ